MELTSLRDLFVHELRDLYSAETQILRVLPEVIEESENPQLREAFKAHLQETERHIDRIEEILADLGEATNGYTCKGMKGLIAESEEMLNGRTTPDVRDAGIISTQQRIEHYEIAGYGTAVAHAQMLEEDRAARLLESTLEEEKNADLTLTLIAEHTVNLRACEGSIQ